MAYKAAMQGRDHRDDHSDPIAGEWQIPTLVNGWAQPPLPLEPFAYRRDLPKLAFKGHLDAAGASSGTVAFTLPTDHRLLHNQYWHTTITDGGGTFSLALVFLNATNGQVTITWPVT